MALNQPFRSVLKLRFVCCESLLKGFESRCIQGAILLEGTGSQFPGLW